LVHGGKMNISDNSKEIIVKEINFAVSMMNESSNVEEKLYYFSGVYSMIQRIFNLEYDSDLIYAHFILRETYNAFLQRLGAIKAGQTLIPLSDEQFEKLISLTKELEKKIENKKDINATLKELAILSYTTSGNGYYLVQKGLLKI